MTSFLKLPKNMRVVVAGLLLLNSIPAFWGLALFVPKFVAASPGPLAMAIFAPYIALVVATLIGGSVGLWRMMCANRPALASHQDKDY